MNKHDFLKLVGVENERAEYLPLAFMVHGGYGCAGYYNSELNKELADTCVLLNMRLVEFQGARSGASSVSIHDFNDFLERIVARHYREAHLQGDAPPEELQEPDASGLGTTIPLAGIAIGDISLVYPVARITSLMQRAEDSFVTPIPTFLDFRNKSIIIKVLKTRLW